MAVVLDRPRHKELIQEIRQAGARIRLIPDGDVAGAINTAFDETGVDILFGIGGAPEGVLAATALKCLGKNCSPVVFMAIFPIVMGILAKSFFIYSKRGT